MEIFKIKVNVFIEAAGNISLHMCLKEFDPVSTFCYY